MFLNRTPLPLFHNQPPPHRALPDDAGVAIPCKITRITTSCSIIVGLWSVSVRYAKCLLIAIGSNVRILRQNSWYFCILNQWNFSQQLFVLFKGRWMLLEKNTVLEPGTSLVLLVSNCNNQSSGWSWVQFDRFRLRPNFLFNTIQSQPLYRFPWAMCLSVHCHVLVCTLNSNLETRPP